MGTCASCGTEFAPLPSRARYCSNACRQRAYRQRSAGTSTVVTELPAHDGVLLASGPLEDGLLPPDTAVWLRLPR